MDRVKRFVSFVLRVISGVLFLLWGLMVTIWLIDNEFNFKASYGMICGSVMLILYPSVILAILGNKKGYINRALKQLHILSRILLMIGTWLLLLIILVAYSEMHELYLGAAIIAVVFVILIALVEAIKNNQIKARKIRQEEARFQEIVNQTEQQRKEIEQTYLKQIEAERQEKIHAEEYTELVRKEEEEKRNQLESEYLKQLNDLESDAYKDFIKRRQDEKQYKEERREYYLDTYGVDVQRIVDVDGMEGHLFEAFCADLLEDNGYSNVTVTRGSGDQGVDIVAQIKGISYAIQCKNYSSFLSNKPVQEVLAGKNYYDCHLGVVMTNSYFGKSACELAQKTGVILWDRETLWQMLEVLR